MKVVISIITLCQKQTLDFPGAPVVKNPPANADTGLIRDSGRFTCHKAVKPVSHNY